MQRVDAVIGRQLKARAIQFEGATRDPVGIASHGGTKEAPDREVACEILATEHDVGKAPGAIRREDGLYCRAKGDEAHLETVITPQPHGFNRGPVRKMPESPAAHLRP